MSKTQEQLDRFIGVLSLVDSDAWFHLDSHFISHPEIDNPEQAVTGIMLKAAELSENKDFYVTEIGNAKSYDDLLDIIDDHGDDLFHASIMEPLMEKIENGV